MTSPSGLTWPQNETDHNRCTKRPQQTRRTRQPKDTQLSKITAISGCQTSDSRPDWPGRFTRHTQVAMFAPPVIAPPILHVSLWWVVHSTQTRAGSYGRDKTGGNGGKKKRQKKAKPQHVPTDGRHNTATKTHGRTERTRRRASSGKNTKSEQDKKVGLCFRLISSSLRACLLVPAFLRRLFRPLLCAQHFFLLFYRFYLALKSGSERLALCFCVFESLKPLESLRVAGRRPASTNDDHLRS
jgi:hypothetical protein